MIKPDVVAIVMEILRADPDVTALVGSRIYSPIPRDVLETLVRTHDATIVVDRAPAITAAYRNRHAPIGAEGVAVRCYGPTMEDADRVYRAVYMALKFAPRGVVQDGLVQAILPSADPVTDLDPDAGEWPYVWSTYTVLLNEEPVV